MQLVDILNSPWAIRPEKLIELQAIYAAHLNGEKVDIEAIEARLGRPMANEQKRYALQEGTGVAVLEIAGVIAPKANMFTRISGGAVASLLQQQVQSMQADPRVAAVVLDIDSPGGNVHGIPALAAAVRALADAKPTVSVSTGTMASAAYWVGAAASAVYISGVTDFLGSIGVVATHSYDPRRFEGGVQRTEVTAGKYKRLVTDSLPLSAEGRAYMQQHVDAIYQEFVDSVAANRGVSAEEVLEHMADGRDFVGRQAISAGLADGVSTVDALVEELATNPSKFAKRRTATFAVGALPPPAPGPAAQQPSPPPADPSLDPQHAEGHVAMTPSERAAAFAADHAEAAAVLRAEGSNQERERIQAVRAQGLPGHEALVEKLAFDGKTSGPEAAAQVLAAERSKLAGIAAEREKDAPPPVAQKPAPENDKPAAAADPQAAAASLADRIAAKQQEAAKAGRNLSPVQALGLINQES